MCGLCTRVNMEGQTCSICGRNKGYVGKSVIDSKMAIPLGLHADLSQYIRPEQVTNMLQCGMDPNEMDSVSGCIRFRCLRI